MKYLNNYVEEAQTKVFEEFGAFFAFSNKQFEEQAIEGVKYASLGSGLIAPKGKGQALYDALQKIHEKGIEQDLAENGKDAIIQRELGNHEAQITGDLDDTMDALDGYGISLDEVKTGYKIFYQQCVDNDWF